MKKTSRRLESAKRGTKRLRNVSSRRAYAADLEGRKKGSGHDYPKFIGSLHELVSFLSQALETSRRSHSARTVPFLFSSRSVSCPLRSHRQRDTHAFVRFVWAWIPSKDYEPRERREGSSFPPPPLSLVLFPLVLVLVVLRTYPPRELRLLARTLYHRWGLSRNRERVERGERAR